MRLAVALLTLCASLAFAKDAPAAKPAEAKPAPAAQAATPPASNEVTLSGTVQCAKCGLKMSKSCNTAISVKEGEKTVNYLFDGESEKEHHSAFCKTKKEGSVTGVVTEKDGQKFIKVSKLETK